MEKLSFHPRPGVSCLVAAVVLAISLAGCGHNDDDKDNKGADGPVTSETPIVHQTGNVAAGQTVFRFETFGNENFFTDAMRLQQGIVAAGVTPIDALTLGLSVDIDALDTATQQAIAAELQTDLSPANAPLLIVRPPRSR